MKDQDFDGASICGNFAQVNIEYAKWPGENPHLPWHADMAAYRGSLTVDQLWEAFRRAWAYWEAEIEIRPERVAQAQQALIRKHFASIDGSSGTLAWSYLADNTNNPKTQRYDNGESWVIANPERPTSGIDLVRVACHEIGHVLGLDHDSSTAEALMRPSYSTSIPKPTERDLQRMVGLGYKRRTTPPPPPPPPPGPTLPPVAYANGAIVIDGRTYHYNDGRLLAPG